TCSTASTAWPHPWRPWVRSGSRSCSTVTPWRRPWRWPAPCLASWGGPARIYLGDAGSYLVGTGLALLLALTATADEGVATTAGALLFVAVPVADTTIAIVRRRRAGRPLLEGDRGHIYDQLVDRGWSAER